MDTEDTFPTSLKVYPTRIHNRKSYKSPEPPTRSKSSHQIIQRYGFPDGIGIALVEAYKYLTSSFLARSPIVKVCILPSPVGPVELVSIIFNDSAEKVTFRCGGIPAFLSRKTVLSISFRSVGNLI